MSTNVASKTTVDTDVILRRWRTKAVTVVLAVLAVSSVPPLIFSTISALTMGQLFVLPFYYTAFLLTLILLAFRKIDYRVRGSVLLGIAFLLGAASLAAGGLIGNGTVYLVVIPIVGFILVGARAGWISIAVSFFIYIVFAILAHAGTVGNWLMGNWQTRADYGFSLEAWMTYGLTTIMLLLTTAFLVERFQRLQLSTIKTERQVSAELEKHREHLEELVEERTSNLKARTTELQQANTEVAAINKELDAFAYSVSHDLRAPLRSIDGFSQALMEDYSDKLDEQGKGYLQRVRSATQRMGMLIDDLLSLSRVTRSEMRRETVDLSAMAQSIAEELQATQPERQVDFVIAPGLTASGDSQLLHQLMENLLGNSWKFTGRHPKARIEVGTSQIDGKETFFVRDDGVGFDMTYADKLFGVFQRLHSQEEFPGTGVGLSTVQRIVHRHGGQVWAEGKVEEGATFYFTLE